MPCIRREAPGEVPVGVKALNSYSFILIMISMRRIFNMKKKNFCVAVLSASAVLALGASFSSFAAWKAVNSEWVYTDNNGNNVTSAWRTDNGESYYLGDDGYMVRNTLLEDNGNYYYLRNGGQMLKNGWRFLENPSWQGDDKVGDASWYYFDSNGRALRTTGDTVKIADIGGKKYAFDMYGRMLTGWITAAGENISDDSDWATATYYGDSEGDGSLVTNAWVYISVKDDDNEDDNEPTYHFYFASNGKKTVSTEKTIGNVKYTFDDRGVAQDSWVHNSDKGTWKYYGDEEEPKLHTGWFQAVPSKELNSNDHENGTTHWYYANSKGEITIPTADGEVGVAKTIDGKSYLFNEDGEMLTGLRILTYDGSKITKISSEVDSVDRVKEMNSNTQKLVYFSDNGAAKTGVTTVSLDGSNYTFNFKSNGSPRGVGETGMSDGFIYVNGLRLTAEEDSKYQAVEYKGTWYVVNENGNLQKNKKNLKDSDGYYYCTKSSGESIHGETPLSEKCEIKH